MSPRAEGLRKSAERAERQIGAAHDAIARGEPDRAASHALTAIAEAAAGLIRYLVGELEAYGDGI